MLTLIRLLGLHYLFLSVISQYSVITVSSSFQFKLNTTTFTCNSIALKTAKTLSFSECNRVKYSAIFLKGNSFCDFLFPSLGIPLPLHVTLLHSKQPKLYGVLAIPSAIGLIILLLFVRGTTFVTSCFFSAGQSPSIKESSLSGKNLLSDEQILSFNP